MRNWWQSIRDSGSQIKENTGNWGRDLLLILIVLFVGISAFGLGRLSSFEESRPAIRMTQQASVGEVSVSVGGKLVASKKGSKYHFPWCSGAQSMKESNKTWFDSEEEARRAGYTPAKNCKGLQ